MATDKEKARPLHWTVSPSGATVCGKNSSWVRSCTGYGSWDNPLIAGGRRCPTCAEHVAKMRPRVHGGA